METPIERTAILYRYFDANGALLYIGMTERWTDRAAQHESKPWVKLAATITMEQFSDRASLAEAERAAIICEKPIFNVIHSKPRRRARAGKIRLGDIVLSPSDEIPHAYSTCKDQAWYLQNSVRLMRDYASGTPFRPGKYRSTQLQGIGRAKAISALTGVPFQEICRAVGLDTVFRRGHAEVLKVWEDR